MCKRCEDYADQAEAKQAVPEHVYHGHDSSARNSCRCSGCGERIEYNDMVRYDSENDQWWHEGCEEEREPGDGYCHCGERLDVPHSHGDV